MAHWTKLFTNVKRRVLEREIIARFFNFTGDDSVILGVGDDAAILSPPPGTKLAMSSDTLVSGTHFFADASPFFLARKAAAVNLSDMAAMGARPLWMTVSLTTSAGEEWLKQFAAGLADSAADYKYSIVGGDLCRGEITSITAAIVGAVEGPPLLRSTAATGDEVWLSGATGEAAMAVHYRKNNIALPPQFADTITAKLDNPSPRLVLGQKLANVASAAIDISDGLAAAADTIATHSKVHLVLQKNKIPVPAALANLPPVLQNNLILGGGDEYELLFCAPPSAHQTLKKENAFCIGEVQTGTGMTIIDKDGTTIAIQGYEHHFGD